MAKRGPEPERLKIEGMTWQEAIKTALKTPRPPGGWAKPEKAPKTSKSPRQKPR